MHPAKQGHTKTMTTSKLKKKITITFGQTEKTLYLCHLKEEQK